MSDDKTQHSLFLDLLTNSCNSEPWIPHVHCCKLCGELLSEDAGIFFTCTEQWFCQACVSLVENDKRQNYHRLEYLAAAAVLRSNTANEWHCMKCNGEFYSLSREGMHTHTTFCRKKSQLVLAGSFLEHGYGAIMPAVSASVCKKVATTCIFCNTHIDAMEDWPRHLIQECTRVPCALSYECVLNGMNEFARQQIQTYPIGGNERPHVFNLSSVSSGFVNEGSCSWGEGRPRGTTWNDMLEHLQETITHACHSNALEMLSSMRAQCCTKKTKPSADPPSSAGKSPREFLTNQCVIIVSGKKAPLPSHPPTVCRNKKTKRTQSISTYI